jgi:hypothetical protein
VVVGQLGEQRMLLVPDGKRMAYVHEIADNMRATREKRVLQLIRQATHTIKWSRFNNYCWQMNQKMVLGSQFDFLTPVQL